MVFTLTLVKGNIKWNRKPCERCGESTNHLKSRKCKQCGLKLQKRQRVIKPVSSNQFSYHKQQLSRKVIKNFFFRCDTHEVTHQHQIVLLLFYFFQSVKSLERTKKSHIHTYFLEYKFHMALTFMDVCPFCFVNSLKMLRLA